MNDFDKTYTAWLDGELSESQKNTFEKELAARKELPVDPAKWKTIREVLHDAAKEETLPNADFIRSEVLRKISSEISVRDPERHSSRFWRLAWMGTALGATAAALTLLWSPLIFEHRGSGSTTEILVLNPMQPGMDACVVKGRHTKTTVVWLQGHPGQYGTH